MKAQPAEAERTLVVIAAAGPLANLLLALVFGLAFRAAVAFVPLSPLLATLLAEVVIVNIALAIFNLVPIPPLDGSRVLFWFLPESAQGVRVWLERSGWLILLFFIFFAIDLIAPLIRGLARLFLGAN